jgi:hypothetical protein
MTDDRKQLIKDHLNHTREELLDVIGRLTPTDWEKPVQAEGAHWTVRQVVLHLATAETGQINTGKAIAAGQPTIPNDFDLNRYNNRQVEKNKDKQPPEILFSLAESRQKLFAFIDQVAEADLDKRGKHARGDVLSLEQLFYRIGEHEAEHAAIITAALSESAATQTTTN